MHVMTRVASLYLPQLPIERLRQQSLPVGPLEVSASRRFAEPIDDYPGACSVPRGGGWRPGAQWAHGALSAAKPKQSEVEALPSHRRPTMREMGRRSEAAEHPFRAMPPDEGSSRNSAMTTPQPKARGMRPMILIERVGQRDVLTAACPHALALGLRPGMAAAHARALVVDLEVRDAEPEADRAWLERLALHAIGRWTPTASVSGNDGLWLDLTGTTHLFGGEERFCWRLLRFFRRLGFTVSVAIAGTPGAAHAIARYGRTLVSVIPPGGEATTIAGLPLSALRLEPGALAAGARFGLERIADLYAMPRGPLARRLGMMTVTRLDQARGLTAEPIVPIVAFEEPCTIRRLLEPIATAEALTQVIGDLVDEMADLLQARGLGLRAVVLTCQRVDGIEQRIGFGTARATRDPKHLKRLFAMRIELIEPDLGVEAMVLSAPRVEALHPVSLAAGLGEARTADMAPLVDQLVGRVGPDALFRMGAQESDVPERAVARVDPLSTPAGWPKWKRPARLLRRPERLLHVVALLPDHPPRRFVWRHKPYRVVAGDGPERIHGEWWRSEREMWAVRDYFRVEAESGERFWLFRRGDGVEERTGDLSWYMHGLFG